MNDHDDSHHRGNHRGNHRGLADDLDRLAASLLRRRRAPVWLAGVGAVPLLACGGGGDSGASTCTSTTTSTTTTTSGDTTTGSGSTNTSACAVCPEETAGPFPADGSKGNGGNTISVLTTSGIVRSDIRPSIPATLGSADGVPLTLADTASSCANLAGCAIYVWHCDRDGRYSLYSAGAIDQNYLRGVQATDASGQVTFTTIFPACYSGRMPHIHVEVYRSLNSASSYSNKLKTTQIAFPTDVCSTVYASTGYEASVRNFAAISLASDNVFSDNAADGTLASETCSIAGSVAAGYVASLTLGIPA